MSSQLHFSPFFGISGLFSCSESEIRANQSWQAASWARAPSRRACRGSPPTIAKEEFAAAFLTVDRALQKKTHIGDDHAKK
jgi:hypothetical protein